VRVSQRKKEALVWNVVCFTAFAALVSVYLWPIWEVKYLPHQDGPAHLYNVKLLRDLWSGGDPTVTEMYRLNDWWLPTWFGRMLLYLLTEFVPYLTAQKLLVSAYLLTLPVSLAYASRALGGNATLPAVFGFAAASSYLLNMGFYMYCWSLAVAILAVGYWMRKYQAPDFRSALVLGALGVLLYYTHVVSIVMAALAIGVVAIASVAADWRTLAPKVVAERIGWPLLGLLPAVLLLFAFQTSRQTEFSSWPDPLGRIIAFAGLTSIVSFECQEFYVTVGLMLVLTALGTLLLVRRSGSMGFVPSDLWLLVALVWLATYLVAPETNLVSEGGMRGGGFMLERLQLFPLFGFVLWIAAQPLGRAMFAGSVAATAIPVFLLAGMRLQYYEAANAQLTEYVAAGSTMKSGATLLPLHLRKGGLLAISVSSTDPASAGGGSGWTKVHRRGSSTGCGWPLNRFVHPLRHASNYLALEYGVHSLRNYEANMGYFPLLFRPGRNPYRQLGAIEKAPPSVPFGRPKSQVDYVLLWPMGDASPLPPEIAKELAVFEFAGSSPHGLARVYRRATGTQQ
jgi:hypothetical protein